MKSFRYIVIVLCIASCGLIPARAQDMDSELTQLSDNLVSQIQSAGNKKITVLDFTDLDNNPTELGKYIAEQLTVDLVTKKHDFAILNRANLKRILDEHKLTASGLVEPENAKQLGKFAGVDAMIFGKIASIGGKISVTAQIVSTETAEVTGGGKAKFQEDESVRDLASKATKADSEQPKTDDSPVVPFEIKKQQTPAADTKPFGDLQARVDSFRLIPGDRMYGYATFTIVIANKSATDTYGVGFDTSNGAKLNLSNGRGEDFYITELSGIETLYESGGGYLGGITEVLPNNSITITGKGQVQWNGKNGDYPPYRFQTGVVFGIEDQGRYPNKRKYNLVIDSK